MTRWQALKKRTLVIVLATVMVAAAVAGALIYIELAAHPSSTTTSVQVEAVAFSSGANGSATSARPTPVAGADVSIFSFVPSSLDNVTLNPQGNPAQDVLLWQGSTGTDGSARGSLGPTFTTLVHSWGQVASQITAKVSLLVEATYFVYDPTTNTTEGFSYTNYVPYSPWSPPASFDVPVVFDLSHPVMKEGGTGVAGLSGSLPGSGSGLSANYGTGGCPNPSGGLNTDYDHTFTGNFTMFMENNTGRTPNGWPELVAVETIANFTTAMNFTGAGGVQSSSGITSSMTSQASWSSNTTKITITGSAVAAGAANYSAIGLLYIPDVTMHVLRQTYTHTYWVLVGSTCVRHTDTWHYANLNVQNVPKFEFHAVTGPSVIGDVITQLEMNETGGQRTASNASIAASSSESWLSMTNTATGYSTLANQEGKAAQALSTFDTALGVGLAVMAALDAVSLFGDDEPAVIVDALSIVNSALAVFAYVLSAMSSVSFSMTDSTSIDYINVVSDFLLGTHGGFHDQVLEAPSTTTLTVPNGTFSAQMPTNVVGWPYYT